MYNVTICIILPCSPCMLDIRQHLRGGGGGGGGVKQLFVDAQFFSHFFRNN